MNDLRAADECSGAVQRAVEPRAVSRLPWLSKKKSFSKELLQIPEPGTGPCHLPLGTGNSDDPRPASGQCMLA
jgi:hypothetical protein